MEFETEAPESLTEEPETDESEIIPVEEEFETTETAPTETGPEETKEETSEEMSEVVSNEEETESLEGESLPFYSYISLEEPEELPEGEISLTDTEAIVQAIERQTAEIQKGNLALCIGIGLLVGIVFVQGFRLRRI